MQNIFYNNLQNVKIRTFGYNVNEAPIRVQAPQVVTTGGTKC